MDNFFRHCQKFDGSPATDIEMVKLLKVTRIWYSVWCFKEPLSLTDTYSQSVTSIMISFHPFFLIDFLKVLSKIFIISIFSVSPLQELLATSSVAQRSASWFARSPAWLRDGRLAASLFFSSINQSINQSTKICSLSKHVLSKNQSTELILDVRGKIVSPPYLF